MLTESEFREYVGLIMNIEGEAQCFSSRDYARMLALDEMATDDQYHKAKRILHGSKEEY